MTRPVGTLEKTSENSYRVRVTTRFGRQSSRSIRTEEEALELLELIREELPEKVKVTNHPLYSTWKGMKVRCYNRKFHAYKFYGGRGIEVCQQWRESFQAFAEDMGERPEGMTLDRIDNDRNYEPGNCRWADQETQIGNRGVRTTTDTGETHIYRNGKGFMVVVTRKGIRMGKTHRSLEAAIEERNSILEEVTCG